MGRFGRMLLSEWRKQRWLLLAALSIFILSELIFGIGWMAPKKVDIDFRFQKFAFMGLWMLASSAAGAVAFARRSKHAGDVSIQDYSASTLLLKLFTGLLTAFLSGVILACAIWAFYRGGWRFDGYSSSYVLEPVDLTFAPLFGFIPAFAAGAFLSTLSRRLFAVVALSLGLAVSLYWSVSFLWLRLDLNPISSLKDLWILATLMVASMTVLGITFRVSFRRLRGRPTIKGIPGGLLAIVLVHILV